MIFQFKIADGDFVADYDAYVTYPGAREQGPSLESAGQPAEPPEFAVIVKAIRRAGDVSNLEMPGWLARRLERAINEDDDAFDAMRREHGV